MKHGGKRPGSGRPKGNGKYGEPSKPIRIPVSMIKSVLKYIDKKSFRIPLYGSKVAAGIPSPVDDHIEDHLDLNEYLIKDPATTFLVKVTGNSMIDAGIHENDILVIDKSIPPSHGKIVVAAIDSHLTVKRLHIKNNKLILMPENPQYEPIEINENNDVYIWGIVTNVIRAMS